MDNVLAFSLYIISPSTKLVQYPLVSHGQIFHSPESEKTSGNETKCPRALKHLYINITKYIHTANSIRNINTLTCTWLVIPGMIKSINWVPRVQSPVGMSQVLLLRSCVLYSCEYNFVSLFYLQHVKCLKWKFQIGTVSLPAQQLRFINGNHNGII